MDKLGDAVFVSIHLVAVFNREHLYLQRGDFHLTLIRNRSRTNISNALCMIAMPSAMQTHIYSGCLHGNSRCQSPCPKVIVADSY